MTPKPSAAQRLEYADCCAHVSIVRVQESADAGMTVTAEYWQCNLCKTRFVPDPPFMDDREVTWYRPTAWAFKQVCAAVDAAEAERDTLRAENELLKAERDAFRDASEALALRSRELRQQLAEAVADRGRADGWISDLLNALSPFAMRGVNDRVPLSEYDCLDATEAYAKVDAARSAARKEAA